MADLIERKAAIDAASDGCFELRGVFQRIKEKIEALPSAQPDNKVHLCDSCKHTYPVCPSRSTDVICGNGTGNDNICACSKYEPPAHPEQRWIPVSEKLPNFAQRVLVSTANFVYEAIYFDEDAGWSTYNVTFKDVEESEILAWMPLPEPYREEQDGQNA
jgi:hypothetical protein